MQLIAPALLIWVLVWFSVLGLMNLLKLKFQITYDKHPLFWFGYYLLAILALFKIFDILDFKYFFEFSASSFFLLMLTLFLLYFFRCTYIFKKSKVTLAQLKYNYISKASEIAFQQIMLSILFLTFSQMKMDFSSNLLYIAIFFGFAHLPIFLFLSKKLSSVLLLAAVFGVGLLFFIFSAFQDAYIYSFILHLSFYALIDFLIVKKVLKLNLSEAMR